MPCLHFEFHPFVFETDGVFPVDGESGLMFSMGPVAAVKEDREAKSPAILEN